MEGRHGEAEDSVGIAQVPRHVPHDVRPDQAGMGGERPDASLLLLHLLLPPRQLSDEQYVGQLALRVLAKHGVLLAAALQIVQVDPTLGSRQRVRAARQHDDAGGAVLVIIITVHRLPPHGRQEQIRQQKVSQVIGRHHHLVSVDALAPLGHHDAGVEDEDVEPGP